MRLSPHFTLAEMTKSSTAIRLGIDNTPNNRAIPNLSRLCVHVLEPMRVDFGPFSPTSGYRCLELNTAIGSKPTSQHIKGEAVDVDIPGIPPIDLSKWCLDNLDKWDQLILEFPPNGWVHISLKKRFNRNQTFSIGG